MKRTLTILVAIALSVTSLAFSRDVLAASCTPSSHCYGVAEWFNTPSNEGNYVYLTSSCLNGPNDSNDFADEELWEGTNNSTNLSYWVETGLSYGEINGTPRGGPFWFWADNRPNGGGYNEHYVGSRSLNTTYLAQIGYEGNNKWFVYSDTGGTVGTSTSNPPYSRSMETGQEFTSNSYNISGFSNDLSWFDLSAYGHANWVSGTNHSNIYYTGSPAYAYWNVTYSSVGYYANCGHSAIASAARNGSSRPAPLQPGQVKAAPPTVLKNGMLPVPASAVGTLVELTRKMAANAGNNNVTISHVVRTTRQQANAVGSGARVNSDQAVYLVQARGQFTALHARVPAGHASPFGHYLTFTVDVASGLVLDWGVSDQEASLSALGPVTSLSQ
jgi:hypothetical protein